MGKRHLSVLEKAAWKSRSLFGARIGLVMPVFDWLRRVDASEEEIPSLDNSYFEVEEKSTDARSGGLSGVLRGCVCRNVNAVTMVGKGKKKSHVIRNFVKDCLPTSLYCRAVAPVPKACLVVVQA